MKIIFIILYAACIARVIQEALARNYKKAILCVIATGILFLMANGYVMKGVMMYRDAVGDTVFDNTFKTCVVIMAFVISYSFWSELRKSFKKS